MHSFVLTQIYFCDLFSHGLPNTDLQSLKKIPNVAVIILFNMPRFETEKNIHFLPIKAKLRNQNKPNSLWNFVIRQNKAYEEIFATSSNHRSSQISIYNLNWVISIQENEIKSSFCSQYPLSLQSTTIWAALHRKFTYFQDKTQVLFFPKSIQPYKTMCKIELYAVYLWF